MADPLTYDQKVEQMVEVLSGWGPLAQDIALGLRAFCTNEAQFAWSNSHARNIMFMVNALAQEVGWLQQFVRNINAQRGREGPASGGPEA